MNDLHAISGAYAIDALDELERARFERHLDECPDCTAEMASLREASAMLVNAVEATPSAELRSRVLGEIALVRPLPPTARPQEVARRTARRFPQLVAAAVLAVLIASGIGYTALRNPSTTTTQAVNVSQKVLDAPDATTQSVAFEAGGHATLYNSKSVGRAVLVTHSMPDAPAGKVYELWWQTADGTFVPAGLMDTGGDRTFLLHGPATAAKGVGVTVEPASGSKSPSTLPVAMFDLNKSV